MVDTEDSEGPEHGYDNSNRHHSDAGYGHDEANRQRHADHGGPGHDDYMISNEWMGK